MAADLAVLVADLAAEQDDLDGRLPAIDDPAWQVPTPAAGWSVLDQIAHLAEGEELAHLALTDEAAFTDQLAGMLADLDGTLTTMEARARGEGPAVALARWRAARSGVHAALGERGPSGRVMWVTGPMNSASFATARLMETWAHGQDVVDALGLDRRPTARLHHIAHLGVATRGFAFTNRGLVVPPPPRVTLGAPTGESWTWGPEAAADSVTGPALDFCLVVTQRRHVDDTGLAVRGDGAHAWMQIAQCFAGPPTDGPPPRR